MKTSKKRSLTAKKKAELGLEVIDAGVRLVVNAIPRGSSHMKLEKDSSYVDLRILKKDWKGFYTALTKIAEALDADK
jgi:hypothetical protein